MLTAIDLDDDFGPMPGEVGELRADRCLTLKVTLLKWRLRQMLLEFGSASVTSRRSARARGTR